MKKSIILAGAVALAFSFNACQKGDNGEQAKKDWAAIDSIAGMKSTAFTDSLNNECMMAAITKGMAMGDSMVNASKKGGKGGKKTTTVTPPPPPPPVDPKKDKMGGNNTNTETKKDKMGGTQQSSTDAKKDKMGGKPK